jgi:hypothetical protein
MHAVLHFFVAMFGLKVNFHKRELVRVNVSRSWLHEVALALNCKVTSLPVLYVALCVGGDTLRLNF